MEKVLVQAVAATIKKIRNRKGVSQERLAHESNLDRTYISGVERAVRNITLDSLEQIICALGLTESAFLGCVADEIDLSKRRKDRPQNQSVKNAT